MMRLRRRHRQDTLTEQDRRLLQQLFEAKMALDGARQKFQYVTEPDMVASCIYEMHAGQARYDHLLGQVRALGLSLETSLYGREL